MYQLVQLHSGVPLTLGYMQSMSTVLCGGTAITPEGSKEWEPLKTLMRIEGALSSE